MTLIFLLFTLLHLAVPAVCVALYGATPWWLAGSILFAVATILTAHQSRTALTKSSLCLLSGVAMLLNLMLGVSYYLQGVGFNDQYFFHLDVQSLGIAASAYGWVFFPALLLLVLSFLAPLQLFRTSISGGGHFLSIVALWIAAVASNYPLHSLLNYKLGGGDGLVAAGPGLPEAINERIEGTASSTTASTEMPPTAVATSGQSTRKNIILIYAEGLEQLYFDQELFGDIVPKLRTLSQRAHQFTNVYQVPGTSWTIAGIVASQCGFPVLVGNHMASNSTLASTERPFEEETCFADILEAQGYATVYMGGAPLGFAGKGNFLRTHGYQRVMGREELMPLLPDPDYNMGWGLHDDSLFELALEELKNLEATGEPYLLTLLTLGTHHPSGYVARSCERLEGSDDTMMQAIFCSDQLIAAFIENAIDMVDMSQTMIVLFSDHLAMRNTLWDTLVENRERRRLTWMIFDDRPGKMSDTITTHFDLAPTMLQLAGVNGYPTLGMGTSLMARADSENRVELPEIDATQVPRSLVSADSVRESGFRIAYEDLTLSVGELDIQATKNGWKFETGLFLFVLDEDGKVADTIYSDDFGKLIRELDGQFVVGISIHEAGSEYGDQYFYGRISNDLTSLRVAPLAADVYVPAEELKF